MICSTSTGFGGWCQPNRTGIARLDSYYDPNERRYYISPQSVELAIAEEKAKAAKTNDAESFGKVPQAPETGRTIPNHDEKPERSFPNDSETKEIKELEREIRDLQITNKAKDMYIEKIEEERDKLFGEAISATRKVGQLESKLLQLEGGH